MIQSTDAMVQNMEFILSQLIGFEAELKGREKSARANIVKEGAKMEQLNSRRTFYQNLQTTVGPKLEEALANLAEAEKDAAIVQQKIDELDSSKVILSEKLADVQSKNKLDVEPELDKLKRLLKSSSDEISISRKACADDEQRMMELARLHESIESEVKTTQQVIDERELVLSGLLAKPDIHASKLSFVEDNAKIIQTEMDNVGLELEERTSQLNLEKQRKFEIDDKIRVEAGRLETDQNVLKKRRQEADCRANELGQEKVLHHSLASQRLEIELSIKKTEDGIKHNASFLAIDNRQVNIYKSALIKKQQATTKVKSSIPELNAKLHELQQTLSVAQGGKSSIEQALSKLKAKVDASIVKILESQEIEEHQQQRLDKISKSVAEKEGEIEKWRAEEKKASTFLALMKEKRDVTRRKIESADQKKDDVDSEIHLQELLKLDVSKRLNDATKKLHGLVALHELIKSEKMECIRLSQLTKQCLIEMESRNDELQIRLRSHANERAEKVKTLQKETEARMASQDLRASKRMDKSKGWASCRRMLENVERQEARLDKLRASITSSRKEAERMVEQNEQMASAKDSMMEQLAQKKKQLFTLYENANSWEQALTKGKRLLQQKKEEKRLLELKNEEVRRSISILKKGLHDHNAGEERIDMAKRNLELQIIETVRISQELESPNQERFRTLDGHDPSEEELTLTLMTLDRLEKSNREVLLAREITLKEVLEQIEKTEEASQNWKSATQVLLKDMNEYQGRLHELKRVHTSHVSEIRMYDDLIRHMNESKVDLEMREQLAINKKPSKNVFRESATAGSLSTEPGALKFKERRPTAYLPDGDEEKTIKVPRPYGAMAPFQPTGPGATMRHIRKPQNTTLK